MKEYTKTLSKNYALVRETDLIFVLAGLEARKEYGLELFNQGRSRTLVFSVGRFEIRKLSRIAIPAPIDLLSIASPVPPPQRHYFVWFERNEASAERIPIGRFGTWSEIEALGAALRGRPEIGSVTVVSSSYHLARIRLCCHKLLSRRLDVQFVASPQDQGNSGQRDLSGDNRYRNEIIAEWIKIPAYAILSLFPRLNAKRY